MESIEILSRLLKFLGWLSIILAILVLILSTFMYIASLGIYFFSAQLILTGLIFLGLAHGLSKKEKWAWYTAFVIFILALIANITQGFFIEFSVAIFISISIKILCLWLLVEGKQPFIKQPKEKISQWFHKPYFVMVIVGALLLHLSSGGFLVWQYFGTSEEETKAPKSEEIFEDKIADWKNYRNEEYGFEVKYPQFLKLVSTGPNLEQQKLEKGETISGTIQPFYDIIIFLSKDGEQFKIEIFHPYEKSISEKNYTEDYLYLFGACDIRLALEPTVINLRNIHNNDILEVKGKQLGSHMETPTFRGCHYLKNNNGNLIVFSTADFDNQSDFQEIDFVLNQMLSTFKFLE